MEKISFKSIHLRLIGKLTRLGGNIRNIQLNLSDTASIILVSPKHIQGRLLTGLMTLRKDHLII